MKKAFLVLVFCFVATSLLMVAGQQGGGDQGAGESGQGQGEGPQPELISAPIGNENQQQNQGEENQIQNQEKVQVMLLEGEHNMGEGKVLQVQTQSNNRLQLMSGGFSAETGLQMTQEQTQEKTILMTQLSNGRNAEIKVMPDAASERAMERLMLKVCSEENNCQMELKEVGRAEQVQVAYEVKAQKQAKLFGLFRTKMLVQAQINAENGEVIQAKKPWWAFLASEE